MNVGDRSALMGVGSPQLHSLPFGLPQFRSGTIAQGWRQALGAQGAPLSHRAVKDDFRWPLSRATNRTLSGAEGSFRMPPPFPSEHPGASPALRERIRQSGADRLRQPGPEQSREASTVADA